MIARPLMSFNTEGRLFDSSDLSLSERKVRDITADADARFFRSIPEGRQKDIKKMCMVGTPGAGKSTALNARAHRALEKYGRSNVNLVYCDDPMIFLDCLDDRPVQYGIIDDATNNASSREIHKQTQALKAHNRIRHIFSDVRKEGGLLLEDWAWQRWIELDPGFRYGNLLLFKTAMMGSSDRRDITDKIGDDYSRILDRVTDMIDLGDNTVKSISVGRITAKRIDAGGVGIYVTRDIPHVLPELLVSKEYFGVEDEKDLLEKYRDDPKWSKRIQCFDLYDPDNGCNQIWVADQLGVRQGYVSDSIRRVRDLLAK